MDTVTSKDGTRIAYDRTGRGAPVILVAGAFSYRKYPAQVKLAELLSQHFTVFNYDRRGRGDSGDTPPYRIAGEIEDLEALPNAELVARKGLGHAKKLTPKVIAATLTEFFGS